MKNNFAQMGWKRGSGAMEYLLKSIEKELADSSSYEYLIVSGHHPTRSTCKGANPVSKELIRLDAMLHKYSVTAYLFGHWHSATYSMVGQVAYILSGNGARSLTPCNGETDYESSENGFSRGIFTSRGFQTQFINEDSIVVYTTPIIPPRITHGIKRKLIE